MEELAESIRQVGLLFPPLVVVAEDKEPIGPESRYYYLVHGHRRVAAARLLQWARCSFFVAEGLTLEDQLILNLAENARENLTPAEIGERCASILASPDPTRRRLSTDELGQRIGYSGSHVRNLIRLRQQLHPDLWAMMVRLGHRAPVAALLTCLAHPIAQQLQHWESIGSILNVRVDGDGKPARGERVTWKKRARQLVDEAAQSRSEEFARGASWLLERLTGGQGIL